MDKSLLFIILMDICLFFYCIRYGMKHFVLLSFIQSWILFAVLGVLVVVPIFYFWLFGKVSVQLLGKEWVLPQGCFLCLVEGRHLCESCRFGELADAWMVERVLKG